MIPIDSIRELLYSLGLNIDSSIDDLCNCFTMMTLEQHQINKGCLFVSSGQIIPSLAFGAKAITRIQSPLEKYAFFKGLFISCEGATLSLKLIRDVTITTSGTLVPNVYKNLNHNSSNTSDTRIYQGSAYTGGEIVRTIPVHGNTTATSSSSGTFQDYGYETLITQNGRKDYILELENIDQNSDTAYNIGVSSVISEEDVGLIT